MAGRYTSLNAEGPPGFVRVDGRAGLLGGTRPGPIDVRGASQSPVFGFPNACLQYVGFEQTGRIRAYRFKRILRGEKTQEFVVSADCALFVKHSVGIQEGPALSLRLLSAAALMPPAQSLSDLDMLAHLARRAAAGAMHGRKRSP
jgi:hypothetical protein